MQLAPLTRVRPLSLTSEDKARLHDISHLFEIEFRQIGSDEYLLRHVDGRQSDVVLLSGSVGHKRLLTEICSKCAPWVYFHLNESCQDSLLNHSDARLRRIAELYARDRQIFSNHVMLVH